MNTGCNWCYDLSCFSFQYRFRLLLQLIVVLRRLWLKWYQHLTQAPFLLELPNLQKWMKLQIREHLWKHGFRLVDYIVLLTSNVQLCVTIPTLVGFCVFIKYCTKDLKIKWPRACYKALCPSLYYQKTVFIIFLSIE